MGTRADFYVGREKESMEWLGSIAWDGYPGGINPSILACTDEDVFRAFVESWLKSRKDATFPRDGWPWPWDNSGTTDYAYAFDSGRVYGSCFGQPWFVASEPEPSTYDEETEKELPYPDNYGVPDYPDMSNIKNVTFGKRSGLLVFSAGE